MGFPADDYERTMAIADIALGQMKALRQPASPRNFELWYTYASGSKPSLNETINELVARNGTLGEAEAERLYESYISAKRLTDQIDQVGSQVMGEIIQIMATIGNAAGKASNYSENLANVTQSLVVATDKPAVRAIVEGLVQATQDMKKSNHTLEARLNASKIEITQLQRDLEAVRTESLTDPLTSLANRKLFDEALTRAIARPPEDGQPLALLMMDIDHFKRFNDSYGHLIGDQVLRLVAKVVQQNVKGQNTAARYGGEEFAVILPNTNLRAATTVADHIRRAVMLKGLVKRSSGEQLGRVTISVGVAAWRPNDTARTLIERSDACLYAAKRNGRNQVIGENDPEAAIATAKVA